MHFQEEYKDQDGVIIGLGYDYRESIELTIKRLAGLIELDRSMI